MIRSILSLKRLNFEEKKGKVGYKYGKESLKQEKMDYSDFIARVSPHIPDKGQVIIHYNDLYGNAYRGKKEKVRRQFDKYSQDRGKFLDSGSKNINSFF